jgi:two-component system chemotaxis sensor kinase CheA
MNDRELLQLIFLPGFSTAEKITSVSGRGVGMDVVKTNIEKIGGTVDIQSEPEQSTTVKLKIPLTLAIIPALMVTSGGDRYAIPQVSLLELVRLEGENARRAIEMFHGTPVYRLRGSLLPVVYLNRLLQVNCQHPDPSANVVHIVVLQVDHHAFGLVVDGVSDTEEIVVKPLAQQLKMIPLFAGAAIMGDGRVALILDVFGIARSAGVISEVHKRSLAHKEVRTENSAEPCQTLLLVELNPGHRLAVPLPLVTRLEEFPLRAVQKTAYGEVVWYRGQILPLIHLSAVLPGAVREPVNIPKDALQVVVYSEGGRCVGLVVDHILDAVETSTEVQYFAHRPGILGSMMLQQRVTDLLDLRGIVRAADPGLLEPVVAGKA